MVRLVQQHNRIVWSSANIMFGILKYFKHTREVTLTPKVREMATREVKKVEKASVEVARAGVKMGHYDFPTDNNKAKVAKYAFIIVTS